MMAIDGRGVGRPNGFWALFRQPPKGEREAGNQAIGKIAERKAKRGVLCVVDFAFLLLL